MEEICNHERWGRDWTRWREQNAVAVGERLVLLEYCQTETATHAAGMKGW
jgi:hypothetical protein